MDNPPTAASVLRRLAALLYDLALLASVLVVASALVIVPYIALYDPQFPATSVAFRTYLLVVILAYFVYPWAKGGQTLGMRAWRLVVVREDASTLDLEHALKRFLWSVVTLAPIGLLWALFDRKRLTPYDRLSHTRVVRWQKPSR